MPREQAIRREAASASGGDGAGAPAAVGTPTVVSSAAELERRAAGWRRERALGIDTEFVRERTFYPGLGLVQVSDGREHVLVDPVAIDDLEPLRELLADPGVTKVLHACGEDLEVFFHRFGEFPRPIFDTQIAAAFAGLGPALGYGRLVERLFGVELPKAHTRSDWLRRPLTAAQKRYAALDVAYLLPAYRRLRSELRRAGREDWVRQELAELADARRFLPDPETVYRDLGRSRTRSRRELAVLRAVCAWREREARRRDLPRNFVLSKEALTELARQRPADPAALAAIPALRPADVRRHGRALLRLVRDALELPSGELPEALERPTDLAGHRREVERLRRAVAARARELGIAAELLATRRTVEAIVRRFVTGETPTLPGFLTPWRREILDEVLAETFPESPVPRPGGEPRT